MTARTFSLNFNIDGFTRSAVYPRDYEGMLHDGNGVSLSAAEARAHLAIEKAKGHMVIPCSSDCGVPCQHAGCPGFDYKGRGCGGRPVKERN
ncbi:hypothetical protein ACQUFY_06350 [Robbsia andropogonis]|uniref:hypothetical protein n=1 Tax=Robbsia andropogonis TaxID=28092 RepID=UPI003D1B8683